MQEQPTMRAPDAPARPPTLSRRQFLRSLGATAVVPLALAACGVAAATPTTPPAPKTAAQVPTATTIALASPATATAPATSSPATAARITATASSVPRTATAPPVDGAARSATPARRAEAQTAYTFTDLGDFRPSHLNDAGQIVGAIWTGPNPRAALWQEGQITELSPGFPHRINAAGQIIGSTGPDDVHWAGDEQHPQRALLWQGGATTDLATLPGHLGGHARGINAAGQVVGWSIKRVTKVRVRGGEEHAFLWQNGAMTNLGSPPDNGSSRAYAINDVGQAVGSFQGRPVLWDGETMTVLYTPPPGSSGGVAVAINAARQIVGTIGANATAVLWQGGAMTRLPIPYPGDTRANDINAAGQIVGHAFRYGVGGDRAVLWEGGSMTDLNDLVPAGSGWVLTNAAAINDAGQIVGESQYGRGFLLTPLGHSGG